MSKYEVRFYDSRGNCILLEGLADLARLEAWLKGRLLTVAAQVPAKAVCAKVWATKDATQRQHWHRDEKRGWAKA